MVDRTSAREVERWMLIGNPQSDALVIILVVDDSDDDELAGIVARENMVPADHFDGVWGTGPRDGPWLAEFHLTEVGGGVERKFFTGTVHRELLDAILDVPHLVAIMPLEIAGDAKTAEAVAPRLGGALIVEVRDRSPEIGQVSSKGNG
jgi:hypothetical protein